MGHLILAAGLFYHITKETEVCGRLSLPTGNEISANNSGRRYIGASTVYKATDAVTVRVHSPAMDTREFDYTFEYDEKMVIELQLDGNNNIIDAAYSVYTLSMMQVGDYKTYSRGNDLPPERTRGGCHVATCVYSSYDCPQVWTLQRFRDDTLAANRFGRGFIRCYYAVTSLDFPV